MVLRGFQLMEGVYTHSEWTPLDRPHPHPHTHTLAVVASSLKPLRSALKDSLTGVSSQVGSGD